ncbi:MAG: lipopolysaccharide heptosyltransferase II [Pirellulales bacterium]|nr:lipopolysaccharide heptosyltransferase II [Pirellulales bacterium]
MPNWLGDLTMATPALRAMRRRWKDARLVGILRPYLADVLGGAGWLDEQWFYDPRSADSSLRAWAVARRFRREKFDLAIHLTNSLRTAAVAWWGRIGRRIGFVRYGRGPLLTEKLYLPRRQGRIVPEPMVDVYLALARAAGCGDESPRLELATLPRDEQSADAALAALDLRRKDRIVLLNCGGAYGAAKLWPVEYFAALARRIVAECDHDVLVTCGPKEREIARRIIELAREPRVVSMADQPLDLGTAKACIRRGKLMVSTDSGPRHVAAAFGLPVITLYGPMLPVWGENPTQRAVNLLLDLECIGCHARTCPLKHHRCMRDLTVQRVFGEVVKMLESLDQIPQAA